MSVENLPNCHARFKAKYLHALRRILRSAREDLFTRNQVGLLIEPAEQGVFVMATDGRVLAVIHDADGRANRSFRAILPEHFIKRAAPPQPLQVYCEGPGEIELPEWAQPGEVHIYPVCATILSAMNHPSVEDREFAPALANCRIETGDHWREDDFRLTEGITIPWRRIISSPRGALQQLSFSPEIMYRLQPIETLSGRDISERGSFVFEAADDPRGPIIVRESFTPEFVGAIMPRKLFDPGPMPSWVSSSRVAGDKSSPAESTGE